MEYRKITLDVLVRKDDEERFTAALIEALEEIGERMPVLCSEIFPREADESMYADVIPYTVN